MSFSGPYAQAFKKGVSKLLIKMDFRYNTGEGGKGWKN